MPPSTLRSRITGLGFHVPPRVVTNHDLSQLMDTNDDWIVERTGIRERHFVDANTGSSDLGIAAARKAIADAGRTTADVDFVIFAKELFAPLRQERGANGEQARRAQEADRRSGGVTSRAAGRRSASPLQPARRPKPTRRSALTARAARPPRSAGRRLRHGRD